MGITITYATYGTTNNNMDVTQVCQSIVDTGNDDITVNNATMGGDPDPGVVKSFAIVYILPGATNPECYTTQTATEGQTVDLVP